MKYLIISPIVVSLLQIEYLKTLFKRTLSLLNKLYKNYAHRSFNILTIELHLLNK